VQETLREIPCFADQQRGRFTGIGESRFNAEIVGRFAKLTEDPVHARRGTPSGRRFDSHACRHLPSAEIDMHVEGRDRIGNTQRAGEFARSGYLLDEAIDT